MTDTDLVVIGSGFGGSITAMIARRLGYRVMLLERGRHPRFAIGESASPLAGILLEQLSDRYDLPRLRPLSAFGTWRRTYPHLVCGLKRGFTFFRHDAGQRYSTDSSRRHQLLVAASPSDEVSDTHWLRSDVDLFLVDEAISLGVEYQDRVELERVDWSAGGAPVLVGTRLGRPLRVRSRLVVDASGPRGFLSHALGIAEGSFRGYPSTQALFSHFVDVARCDAMPEYESVSTRARPPYPADDAAVHHVFDGGWMWVLRFGNGLVSAGVAVEDWLATELGLAEGAPAWARLLARFPSIAAQFAEARPVRAFTWLPRLPYSVGVAAGERWAMLPSAAALIDPLFSTGIPLTLLGVERLGDTLARGWEHRDALEHDASTRRDASVTARLIAGSYAGFRSFPHFAAYSMFYFAAASFSEAARRLSSSRVPRAFLCGDSEGFVQSLERLAPDGPVETDADRYQCDVAGAIEAWNVAGLCDGGKRNWYSVDLEDTVRAASKLSLTPAEVRAGLMAAASTCSSPRSVLG